MRLHNEPPAVFTVNRLSPGSSAVYWSIWPSIAPVTFPPVSLSGNDPYQSTVLQQKVLTFGAFTFVEHVTEHANSGQIKWLIRSCNTGSLGFFFFLLLFFWFKYDLQIYILRRFFFFHYLKISLVCFGLIIVFGFLYSSEVLSCSCSGMVSMALSNCTVWMAVSWEDTVNTIELLCIGSSEQHGIVLSWHCEIERRIRSCDWGQWRQRQVINTS